jgi:hypothetical protein
MPYVIMMILRAGVPQASVLCPFLYLIFTRVAPLTDNTLMATFTDDIAIMSSDQDSNIASQKLQQHLKPLQNWMEQWKIK